MVRIVHAGIARRVAVALPVIALAATGVAVAARGDAPAAAGTSLSVPEQALTDGASPLYPAAGPAPAPMQLPPVYETYTGDWARVGVPREAAGAVHAIASFAPVRIDSNGIPAAALGAYQRAAGLLGDLDPGCGVDWALLGAIGRVESNHARFGGNVLDTAGIARPGIIGIALDGSRGTAVINDTDSGVWDGDSEYDRAVGPMQFIPGTWRMSGRDGDGDGARNPQSMADAATSAGVYLCSGPGDLRDRATAYRAILRYNHSDDYARTVMSIADAYRSGVSVVPMNALPAARPASGSSTDASTPSGSGFGWGGSSEPQPAPSAEPSPKPSPETPPSPKPSPTPTPGSPAPAPAPSAPRPALPVPVPPAPAVPNLPLPSVPGVPPAPIVPSATAVVDAVARLLALPHLPALPGDPAGLVRVLDPATAKVVCILDQKVVTCPTTGGLL